MHVLNSWAPDWFLCQNRKSRCWLLSTNLCSIPINFRNLFPLFSYCSKPKAGHHPACGARRSRRPRAGNTEHHLLKFAVPGHEPAPDLQGFTASTWPGCLQAFLWPPCLLAPGLWTTGCYPPSQILPGKLVPLARSLARRRGLWNAFPALGKMLFSTVLSEVKRFQMRWEQGLV